MAWSALLAAAPLLLFGAVPFAHAAEPAPPGDHASAPTAAASAAPLTPREDAARDVSKTPEHGRLALPAEEILGFDFLLNRFNRLAGTGRDDYRVTLDSIRDNLHSGWGTDRDPFKINQLGHPYQGSMYHGFARSAGFNYWESAAYTFGGSAFWEIAGERTKPSRNDQIASGVGGTFLGEALFRMSNLVLEQGGGMPRFWREAAAAAISPSTGFNRLVFDDRFGGVYSSHNAAYFSRLQLGYADSVKNDVGTSGADFKRHEAQADFAIDFGLPGSPGYSYTRPFDYFSFQATVSSANGFENLMTRGLLVGKDYSLGDHYRGVWGIYGTYDYLAPQTFRVSSTAVSLGSTAQWWLSDIVSLQGTALAGVGYAAVGTTHGPVDERSYNYGVAPQALLSFRLTYDDTASFGLTAREYFVSSVASGTTGGRDNIVRGDAALTVRLFKQQALTLNFVGYRRDATFANSGNQRQSRGTIGIFYTLLGQDRFGTVDWRQAAAAPQAAGIVR